MKKFFNKLGMTYVELLVALSLLSLVVVTFSPMLLRSYEQLYKAGEMQENTYSAKSDLEKGLATRTTNNITILKTQMQNVAQDLQVSLRNITTDLQDGMQTLFYGGKGSIRIVSPSTVPDNTDKKDFVLQTIGIKINKLAYGGESKAAVSGGKYTVAIEVFKGNYSSTNATDDEAFTVSLNSTQVILPSDAEVQASNGTFPISITGCDLTEKVLKVKIYYYDENKTLRDAETYIKIVSPTIMMVGRTAGTSGADNSVAYYTSAGMEQVKDSGTRSYTEKFSVEARKMTGGSYPTGTEFKDVVFIDSDPNPLEDYYVLVGTNGVIQRFYSGLNAEGHDNVQSITGVTTEHIFYRDGGLEKIATPGLWGGDKAHQFAWSSNKSENTYGSSSSDGDGDTCWLTEKQENSGIGADAVYGNQVQFSYHYNGLVMTYRYAINRMRNISYILTEKGYALRLAGGKQEPSDYNGYQTPWEVNTFPLNMDMPAETASNASPDMVYRFRGKRFLGIFQDGPKYYEHQLSSVFIRALSSINFADLTNTSDGDVNALNTPEGKQVTLTTAAYIPQFGGMYYLGTVNAHALIQQIDNCVSNDENYAKKICNDAGDQNKTGRGAFRLYAISGQSGGGTGVYKVVENNADFNAAKTALVNYLGTAPNIKDNTISDYVGSSNTVDLTSSNKFFIARNQNSAFFRDLNFTLGFASNRESVYYDIVYNGVTEKWKSYEPYYFLSEYSNSAKTPNYATTSNGDYYNLSGNDYYNIWFPGEFYNLTKTATRDGITVAVGYTVSGSTYQYINPNQATNTSTAMGSIYNDGVLAAVVADDSGSETVPRFTNLLYYKDKTTFDSTSLSGISGLDGHDNAKYSSAYGAYGTHARQNVRFQAVDINCEGGSTANKTYYAYYGDNRGNVYRSKVATTAGLVGYIASVTNAAKDSAPSKMEPITITNEEGEVQELSAIFKEIVSIVAEDNIVLISGTSRTAQKYIVVGVSTQGADGTTIWTWEKIRIGASDPYIHIKDMMVLSGYVYFVGAYYNDAISQESDSSTKGFAIAVPQSEIETVVNDSSKTSIDITKVKTVKNLPTPIYSIAGHSE